MQIGIDFDGAGVWTTQRVVQFHLVILTGEKHESRAWGVVGVSACLFEGGVCKKIHHRPRQGGCPHTHVLAPENKESGQMAALT